MTRLELEIITSLATIVFAILAIGLFIASGGSAAFYAAMVIALAVGFFNAWLISKSGKKTAASTEQYRPKPTVIISPKKSARRRRKR
ncbi:MAG: hypothetical protein KGH98_02640 [Candidatus Micrarchaeota archaeon]|nr:hypothetical protein [Candidatus Micrarchaeota archaeon]